MEKRNRWTQIFQTDYFRHIDFHEGASLNGDEALADVENVLLVIYEGPYLEKETISDDVDFLSGLPEQRTDKDELYQLKAIITNCEKLLLTLKYVSKNDAAEIKLKASEKLSRYVTDSTFQVYVDSALDKAMELAKAKKAEYNIPNNIEDRQTDGDADEEDFAKFLEAISGYQVQGTSNIVKAILQEIKTAHKTADQASAKAEEAVLRAQSYDNMLRTMDEKVRNALKSVEQSASQAGQAADEAEQAKKHAEEMKEDAKSLIPNMLTILGIFVAIIIAVVACYLSVLMSAHTSGTKVIGLVTCLLMGHILVNIIFLLLYLISKLTDKRLSSYCLKAHADDCRQCNQKCTWFTRMRIKYPLFVALNCGFLVGYYILAIYQFISVYAGSTLSCFLRKNLKFVAIIAVVAVIVLVGILFFIRNIFNNTGSSVPASKETGETKDVDSENLAGAGKK